MTTADQPRHVAVIGGGASGVLAASALARCDAGVEIVLVDPKPGRGLAYGGSQALHLLNTRASNMSLDAEDPEHFTRWLNETAAGGRSWNRDAFAPRKVFGDYLAARLARLVEAGRVRLRPARAVKLERTGAGWRVGLSDGAALDVDAVLLATGNSLPQALSFPGRDNLDGVVIDNPWDEAAIAAAPDTGTVLLIGVGLTAVDVAVTLLSRPGGPAVVASSRRGLLPKIHDAPQATQPLLPRPFPRTARGLYRSVRDLAQSVAGGDVYARHHVFLGLKPVIPEIWRGLPLVEKLRFARHLRAWWEVERHRLAPAIAAMLSRGEAQGRFTVTRGRIVASEPSADGARVTLATGGRAQTLEVTRIVNCTGPDWRVSRTRDPLLRSVIDAGAEVDEMGLGLAVDDVGEVQGASGAMRGLYALGPLTRGTFFEITAVPEIRAQADLLARRVAADLLARTPA